MLFNVSYKVIIEMALEDFGIHIDTYKYCNKQTLERVTTNLINLSTDSFKEQLIISQSIILGNKQKVSFGEYQNVYYY